MTLQDYRQICEDWPRLKASHRTVEFYALPFTGRAGVITADETDGPAATAQRDPASTEAAEQQGPRRGFRSRVEIIAHGFQVEAVARDHRSPVLVGVTAGQSGLDLNYGGARDLQLTDTIPSDFQTGHGVPGRFGDKRPSLFLPLWAQKDFGRWSVFGGGGYEIHPGPDNRNFWLMSAALTRSLGSRVTLGMEAYHQTPDAREARSFTGLNLGAIVKLTEHWSLLGAAGPGVQDARQGGQYDVYLAIEATC